MKKITEILQAKVTLFNDIKQVNNCQSITLQQALTECTNPDGEPANLINKIRSTADVSIQKQLKANLPGIVFGAQMKTRANVPDRIINLTGLLCFDIDAADNLGIDMKQAKAKLSKITNIIFCALSVRGNGLWGLIEVLHPERLKDHFTQLKHDFKSIGINLDPSKGGNPTDLRFVSFDPDAYLCESYEVYTRLPQVKPHPPIKKHTGTDPLQTAINKIHSAADGQKHHELLKAARLAGGYVASGAISENEAETALLSAISQKDIHSTTGALNTIKDGLKYGKSDPIEIHKHDINHNVKKIIKQQIAHVAPLRQVEIFKPKLIKEQPTDWSQDIADLQKYFTSIKLPTEPIKLSQCETIADVSVFIDSHLATVQYYNGNPGFLVDLNRLQELKRLLTINSN